MDRTIIYKVVDKLLDSEFGYFKEEEDAKKELELQLHRIARSCNEDFEIIHNGYIGNLIMITPNGEEKYTVISIHPICLR